MSKERHLGKAVLFFLLAVVVGPPVGGILFYLAMLLRAYADVGGAALEGGPDILGFAYVILLFSYILGGIPAAIAALPPAIQLGRTGTVSYRFVGISSLVGAVIASLLLYGNSLLSNWQAPLMVLTIAVPSLAAAFFCRWLAGRIGLLAVQATGSASL